MLRFFSWVGLFLAAALLGACGSRCKDFCESYIECGDEVLEDMNCELEDPDEAEDECVEACEEALEKVDDDDRKEFEDCFDCLQREGADDLWCSYEEQYETGGDECEDVCDDDDVLDAADDFWLEFEDEFDPDLEGTCDFYYY